MMLLTQLSFSQSGEIITWGQDHGGMIPNNVSAQISATVTAIYPSDTSYSVLRENGSIVVWGDITTRPQYYVAAPSSTTTGFVSIFNSPEAFAGL